MKDKATYINNLKLGQEDILKDIKETKRQIKKMNDQTKADLMKLAELLYELSKVAS